MAVLHVRGVPDETAAAVPPDTGRFSDIVNVSTGMALRTGAVRGASEHALPVEDEQVVELEFDGGIRLVTSVAQLRETLDAEHLRSSGEALFLPPSLQVGSPTRGAGRWVYRRLRLLTVDLGAAAAVGIADRLERRLLQQPDATRPAGSLFRCTTPAERGAVIANAAEISTSGPLLLLLHGTASTTSGSFGGFVEPDTRALWDRLATRYGHNIVAFDHPTLSVSPIENALQLIELLPKGATLHIVSHSRGGLIGELLARSQRTVGAPFDEHAFERFAGDEYAAQHAALIELNGKLEEKRLRVERFVRVACPARGTTLASGRLDFYMSIIFNAIGLIPGLRGHPVHEFVTAFLAAVARERTNPRTLPGLEAMMPTAPLIAALNDPLVRVNADLTAIAGDTEGSGAVQRLRTFVTDLFYRENHDLVVQTSAMTGGAARVDGGRFHFAKGPDVDHFRYFRNPETADRVVRGLTRADGSDAGFERITPETPAELRRRAPVPGARPVVFVVPGIMGSHLGAGKNRYWIDPIDIARGRFSKLAITSDDISAQALVGLSYDRLVRFFEGTHEVVQFPYDWRRSILDEAARLGEAVMAKLGETKQPVRIIAHSMGGLVARAMFAQRPDLREQFLARPGSRLLMLGTPNGGSFSIPRVLLGHERVVRYLALLDYASKQEDLLRLIARFPGVLQLLPAPGVQDFFSRDVWDELRSAQEQGWTVPAESDLTEARRAWTLLQATPGDGRFMAYVAGRAAATPVAFRIDPSRRGRDRIQFLATREGDGRVPWATGRLPGVSTWYVNAEHGNIANHQQAFRAYAELLDSGATTLLPDQPPALRGDLALMVMPPDEVDMFPDGDELAAAALGFEPAPPAQTEEDEPLAVSVAHGNLAYARDPVAVGHYDGDTIAGAEGVLDRHLCGALAERRQLGLYPGPMETAEVFLRPRGKPAGAIVVGLGEVGALTPSRLERCFAHAMLRYATVVAKDEACGTAHTVRTADVTTLLIGSGRGGIPLADSIRALVDGALRARKLLASTPLASRVRFGRLEFLELYEDVAISAARWLRRLAGDTAFSGRIQVEERVRSVPGGQRRATLDEPDGWWDRLQIRTGAGGALQFNDLTRRARTELRLVATQRAIVDRFISNAISTTAQDPHLGQTLFDLLLPNELKDYAPDRNNLVLLLDSQSARYPWELLQDRTQPMALPAAVRSGLIRQLEEDAFRERVVTATGNNVLVVGDPITTTVSRLPGARREAEAVAEAFRNSEFDVTPAIDRDFITILQDLYAAPYRVLHLAGHGVLDPTQLTSTADVAKAAEPAQRSGGMVIGDGVLLTPGEINQLRYVPEVVFINCCHTGRVDGQTQPVVHFPRLAANIGQQLIRMGVRAVVAAGWEVEDDAAVTFARVFYEQLLAQRTFGDAVKEAREATYLAHPTTNTWGAYQCYGDQGFVLRPARPAAYQREEDIRFVSVTELLVALDNLFEDAETTSQQQLTGLRGRLVEVMKAIPVDWRNDAPVRAALGRVCAQLDLFAPALRHYRVLLRSRRAQFPVAALEQLANVRSRQAVERWRRHGRPGGNAAARYIQQVRLAISDLENLPTAPVPRAASGDGAAAGVGDGAPQAADVARSAERWSLIGSAYKRLSHLTAGAQRARALRKAAAAYARAAHTEQHSFYPLANRIACDLLLDRLGIAEADAQAIELGIVEVERLAADAEQNNADFWSGIGLGDMAVLRRVAEGAFTDVEAVFLLYEMAWRRGGSPQKLRSVAEQIEWLADILGAGAGAAARAALVEALRALNERVRALAQEQHAPAGTDGFGDG